MRVAVVVTVAVIVRMGFGDFAPGAEIHPHGEREDHPGDGGGFAHRGQGIGPE